MERKNLEAYLQKVPKAELHLHFEGAMQPETLFYLAQKNHFDLPAKNIDDLQKWFVFDGFSHFVTVYHAITNCLQTVEDYAYATFELGKFLSSQNIRYAEVTFTPSNHYRRGVNFETFFTGLTNGKKKVQNELQIELNWVFDIERNSDEREKYANYVVDVAIEGRKNGVVALGLGGKEEGYPAKLFTHFFTRARKAGLHSVPHAGEFTDSRNIWDAIELLGADRIGHGVKAATDEMLLKVLVEKQIPLEINPTSNLKLGIYKNMEDHPLQLLQEKGVIIVLGSDDPSLFTNSLIGDLRLISMIPFFTLTILHTFIINSFTYSFMDEKRKQKMLSEVTNTMKSCITEY